MGFIIYIYIYMYKAVGIFISFLARSMDLCNLYRTRGGFVG